MSTDVVIKTLAVLVYPVYAIPFFAVYTTVGAIGMFRVRRKAKTYFKQNPNNVHFQFTDKLGIWKFEGPNNFSYQNSFIPEPMEYSEIPIIKYWNYK